MKKAGLVIAMVSCNLSDLMGTTRPGSSQHVRDTQCDQMDPAEIESQLLDTSASITNASDLDLVMKTASQVDTSSHAVGGRCL